MNEISHKWLERLVTFKNAIGRLAEVIDLSNQRKLNQFECDSLIKRFEFSFEMAWKLMMSYEKENGVIELHGSKDVVRHPLVQKIVQAYEVYEEKKGRERKSAKPKVRFYR